jgi:hypothetical protein
VVYNATVIASSMGPSSATAMYRRRRRSSSGRSKSPAALMINGSVVEDSRAYSPFTSLLKVGQQILESSSDPPPQPRLEQQSAFANPSPSVKRTNSLNTGYRFNTAKNDCKVDNSDSYGSLKRKKELRSASFADLNNEFSNWNSLPRKWPSEAPVVLEKECSCGNTVRFDSEQDLWAPPRPPTPDRYYTLKEVNLLWDHALRFPVHLQNVSFQLSQYEGASSPFPVVE